MSLVRDANVWLGLSGVTLSGAYLWLSQDIFELPYTQGLGPRALPHALGCIFLLLSIAIVVFERVPAERWESWRPSREMLTTAVTVGLTCAYPMLLPLIGYVPSSFLLYVALMLITRASLLQALLLASVIVAAFYSVFDWFLSIPFPQASLLQVLHG